MTCRHRTKSLFNTLNSSAPATSIRAYTDGSKSSSPETTTCAIFISALNKEHAWTLKKGSSIFTAEVTAIYQALKLFYDMGDCPPRSHHLQRLQFSHHCHLIKLPIRKRSGYSHPGNNCQPQIKWHSNQTDMDP
jgi:hypothetical protein